MPNLQDTPRKIREIGMYICCTGASSLKVLDLETLPIFFTGKQIKPLQIWGSGVSPPPKKMFFF